MAQKKSANVILTVVAAMGAAARAAPRPDPCAAVNFNEQACQAAIQNQGYCWGGRWVRLRYHYPFSYYYDAYQMYVGRGEIVSPLAMGTCTQIRTPYAISAGHGVARGGF